MKTGSVAVVTGASSGIGAALAREYARRGAKVALLARRKEKLEALAAELASSGTEALALGCDVNADDAVQAAIDSAMQRFGRVDVVVANAGVSVAKPIERLKLEDMRRVFETNVFGVVRTAQAALAPLRASRGAFAVIGSVNGYLPVAGVGAYCASKYAARAVAETLRLEWHRHGVSVTHVAPGFVKSEIRLLDGDGRLRENARDPIPSWLVMPTDVAARQIVDAVSARRAELVVTGHGKFAAFVARHAPGVTAAAMRLAGERFARHAD